MNKLEPTYLRYVYDALHKGSLNAENASALPQGFIGLFESEFPADISSVQRISVLRRLTLWALFKGAVSTHLASEFLEEDEEDTKTLIDTYSKWFNSPEPGKYILYHDRLRSYFLQKLSSHEVQSLNETLISYLEAALKDNREDEAQEYALEHLATHMAVESQLDNNYDRLHDFVNQEELWKRQVRVSKEYKWSQQAVQHGIKEGARRHYEMNTLRSTVNSVKLQQEEQNSAQQILDLLKEGDYHTALQRALSFSGDKLMTIYLLIIHELTLGTCKFYKNKKDIINEIIDNIKSNQNIKGSYPYLAIYKYHVELLKLDIDDEVIFDRLNFHEKALLHLLKHKNINYEIHEKLSHRQAGGYLLININILKAESFFKMGKNDEAIFILENSEELINKFKKEDGNNPYGDSSSETSLRSDMDFIVNKFNWFFYIYSIYIKNELNKSSEKILSLLKVLMESLDSLIKRNINVITESGANHLYEDELVELRNKYISCLINVSSDENRLLADALSFLDRYNENELDSTWVKGQKELHLIDLMSKLYKIKVLKNKNERSFSFFRKKTDLNYQAEFLKLDSKYVQAQIILKNCKILSDDKYRNEMKSVLLLVDEIDYGVNTFYLIEKIIESYLDKGQTNDAMSILIKLEKLVNNLKNKNSQFYFQRLEKVLSFFEKLNFVEKFKEYSRLYIQTLLSLDYKIKAKNNIMNSFLEDVRFENIALYKEFNLLLEEIDLNNFFSRKSDLLRINDFDLFYILKSFKSFNGRRGIEDAFGSIYGNVFNAQRNINVLNDFKIVDLEINNQQILSILNIEEALDGNFESYNQNLFIKIKDYLLNIIFENEEYESFIKSLLSTIVKGKDVNRQNIPAYNYTICAKLLLNKDLETTLKIIDSFNFPENPNPMDPKLRMSKDIQDIDFTVKGNIGVYPEVNFTIISLMNYLSQNISEKEVVLKKIYETIDSFTSSDDFSIEYNLNNKHEAYKYVSKKLKIIGLNNEALEAIEYWKKESPKHIYNGVMQLRDYSGITIEIISTLNNLIKNEELLKLIENYIIEHSGYVQHLLDACEILKSLNKLERAIDLAKNLPELIDDDIYIGSYDKSMYIGLICEFLYDLGEFDFADSIHSNLPDDYFSQGSTWSFNSIEKKSNYLIRNNDTKQLVNQVKEAFKVPADKRILSYYSFTKIVYELINNEKKDEAILLLDFYKNKISENIDITYVITSDDFLLKSYRDLNNKEEFFIFFRKKLTSILHSSFNEIPNQSGEINIGIMDILNNSKIFDALRKPFKTIKFDEYGNIFNGVEFDFLNIKTFKKELISKISELFHISLSNEDIIFLDIYLKNLYDSNITSLENGEFISTESVLNMKEDFFEDKFDDRSDFNFIYNNSKDISILNNFLKHKAKLACFFEKNQDEEKLDLLSQLIDIDDWRKISASI